MTSARAFRLVVGLTLMLGGMFVLFGDLAATFDGPPLYMTALLVVIAAGMVLIASAFWTIGRPPDLPTGKPRPSAPAADRAHLRNAGRAVALVAAVGVIVVLAALGP